MTDYPRITRHLCATLAFVAAAGCAGSGGGGAVPGVTDSTIVLGTWGPLSGPAALWGSIPRGIDAYFKMVNDAGGIHGRTVQVIVRDDGYQPSRTVPAVREMVERDGVFGIVSGIGTAPAMAVMDYLVDAGVPWVYPATGNATWGHPPRRSLFSGFTPYIDEAAALVEYVVDSLGMRRLGVIYQNDDFGKSGLVGVEMALESRNLELAAEVSVEVTDSDLSSHVLRLRDAEADAVLLWLTPRHGAIVRGAAARMDFNPLWVASTVLGDYNLMHDITEGLWTGTVGALNLVPFDAANEAHRGAAAAGQRYYPDETGQFFFYGGFGFAELFAEGLRRAGRELTRESFIAAMETLDGWQGIFNPPQTFGENVRQGNRATLLYRVVDGPGHEVLSDWLPPTLDLEAAMARLEAGG